MGSGKSTALAALERLGAAVLSSDAVVHELYEHDEQLRDAVVERWGEQVAPGGVVDRSAVAKQAFAGAEERAWLESLLWPMVGARVAAWLTEARADPAAGSDPPRAAIVEVPLLFEAGLEGLYDATIAVISDEVLRQERASARGHALADERSARQLSQQEKAQRATYVVRNDGTVQELEQELSAVLDKLEA
jgi:dephospho-CoA kinase